MILGAGFTGLAAGIKTKETIYEATGKAGGICTSYNKSGFQFFNGGPHLLFGKGVGLDYIKSLVPVNEYTKKAGVYYNSIFPYPIQTTAQMPISCNEGSMKDWVSKRFSQAECNLFFNPFNEKYTAGLYDSIIQYDDYKTPPAGSNGFVSTFCDPVDGLDTLVDKMAAQNTIKYNSRAIGINTESKYVEFKDGIVCYDRLISTIPLGQLLYLCGNKSIDLPYSSVFVLNIGAEKGRNFPSEHWLYIPFCKAGFHRITFYSNIDATKAPEGKANLAVEIAFGSEYDYEDLDVEYIEKCVIEELQSWGFIGDVIVTDPSWVRCAYTWLFNKEDRINALQWLEDRGIKSIGRYGNWVFTGITNSIEQGFNVEI